MGLLIFASVTGGGLLPTGCTYPPAINHMLPSLLPDHPPAGQKMQILVLHWGWGRESYIAAGNLKV
jgi:hypothetical protein